MPALTLATEKARRPSQTAGDQGQEEARSSTPPRPSYSPVTPVFPHATLASRTSTSDQNSRLPDFTTEPSPVPISESDNPDAIALRSAISVLQMQRQQSLRDIRNLDKMKKAAVANPEAFAIELTAGSLSSRKTDGLLNLSPPLDESPDDDEMDFDTPQNSEKTSGDSDFGKIPFPQNVVRCPPINWAKYHIVGASLDKLHEEQRRRPSAGEPRRGEPPQRAPEHVVAAPYRPFVDKLEPAMRTRSGSKGKNG